MGAPIPRATPPLLVRSILPIALGIVAWLGVSQAEADTISGPTTIGNWTQYAYNDSTTKSFTDCVAVAKYKNNINLLFAVDRTYKFYVGLSNKYWNIDQNTKYTVHYRIDNYPWESADAYAFEENGVRINPPTTEAELSRFAAGRLLQISTPSSNFYFDLRDSGAVLDSLRRCVASYQSPNATNPFQSNSRNPFVAPTPNSQNVSNADFIAMTLAFAGLRDAVILDKSQLTDAYAGVDLAWKIGDDVVGTGIMVKGEGWNVVDTLTGPLIANDSSSCDDDFATTTEHGMVSPNTAYVEVSEYCGRERATGETLSGSYIFLPLKDGGIMRFMHIGPHAARVKSVTDTLLNGLRAALKPNAG